MLSVIVPVYRVEAYLCQCVDSILSQSLRELEVILVDDGSDDRCPLICDEYAAKDKRVRVIHKPNGGLMSAWKRGAEEATGDYIGFVDSDDWIEPDMYEKMLRAAVSEKADIVCAALIREYEAEGRRENEPIFCPAGDYDREKIRKVLFPRMICMGTMLDRFLSPNRVTKLFRRELVLHNLSFCDERVSIGEDMVTVFSCVCDAQRLTVMPFFPYHYRIRESSHMGRYNPNFTKQALVLNETLEKIACEKNVYDFSPQLRNDLLSLVYYGIERNIASGGIEKKEMIGYIRESFQNERVRAALKNETLSKRHKKCAVYRFLLRITGAGGLYRFIRYVVLFKRRHFGY